MEKMVKFVVILCLVILLLRVTSLQAQWTENGVVVCSASGYQYYPKLTSDGNGGAIITWHDNRYGYTNVYAQKIDFMGRILWENDGVPVCTELYDQWHPQIISDGLGGAIITWWDNGNSKWDVYAQKLDTLGKSQWTANGIIVCSNTGWEEWGHDWPRIIADSEGGAIIVWNDNRNESIDIYTQRIDASGNKLWNIGGVPICTAIGRQQSPETISDGALGIIATWTDYRNVNSDIYAQRIDRFGNVLWASNGISISSHPQYQWRPQIATDGSGGAIIAWWDFRNGEGDIYAQRIDSSGELKWNPDPVAVCTAEGDQGYYNLQVISDGSSGVIISWEDYRNSNWDIYAQKIDIDGHVQWAPNGVPICAAPGTQGYHYQGAFALNMIADSSGGAFMAWVDERNATHDIYAQKINSDGIVQWTTDGVNICTAEGIQDFPQLSYRGFGGINITWHDARGGAMDIYALGIDENGEMPDQEITISGVVNSDCQGILQGITVDLIDAQGEYYTTFTNEEGRYVFEEIPYSESEDVGTLSLVLPISFEAISPENAETSIIFTEDQEINFSLACIVQPAEPPRQSGYWKHQANVYLNNKGVAQESEDDMRTNYPAAVFNHIFENQLNSIAMENVTFLNHNDISPINLTTIQSTLTVKKGTMLDRAKQQCLALLLNIVSGKLLTSAIVSSDGANTSQALQHIAYLILDGDSTNDEDAKEIGEIINNSQLVDEGIIPLCITYIAYTRYSKKLPYQMSLEQNYPNPFNPSTIIKYYLPDNCYSTLTIYDVRGRNVAFLVGENKIKGMHVVEWDGLDMEGNSVASGIYFYRLVAGDFVQTKKMVLLR